MCNCGAPKYRRAAPPPVVQQQSAGGINPSALVNPKEPTTTRGYRVGVKVKK